jgi:alkylation response protein AidB-like acyl-CoA dehydrogenase
MAKLFATEAVSRAADRAVQRFGGQGVMEEGRCSTSTAISA